MSWQISQQDAAAEILARRRARETILDFTTYTKTDYTVNWHHRALCDALDRLVDGDLKRLMVFMPPRHGKSELVSRRLPAYILGRNPDLNIIACAYAADLASRMNRDVQRIIDSREYANVFPGTSLSGTTVRSKVGTTSLRNSDLFEIVGRRGGYRSAGVGGGITGMGADFGIIDDPIKNQEEAGSSTTRERIWEWYTTTFYTRLDSEDSRILLTMTRWHEDDLAGRVIRATERDGSEPWEIVRFPALAEPDIPGDPRPLGDPLWPDKFSLARLTEMKIALGPYPWAALYQQTPKSQEGALFKREMFRYFEITPTDYILHGPFGDRPVPRSQCTIFQTCDPAGSLRASADYFALGTWALTPYNDLLLLDMIHTRLEGPDQPGLFRAAYARWSPVVQGVESKGLGLPLYQQLAREGLPVYELKAETDKFTRALPMAARYNAGSVYHRQGAAWLDSYEDELIDFPHGAHDDQVDVASHAYALVENFLNTARDVIVYGDEPDLISPY